MTAPGVPDIYQGNEIWDFSLVDPDNRRPVDYELRRQMLAGLTNADPAELLNAWPDGRIKLFITQRLLHFRRDHRELFQRGSYVPLKTEGAHAESCVAFAREHDGEWIVVIAPRLTARVGFPATGDRWQGMAIELPQAASSGQAMDLFTGRELRLDVGALRASEAMAVLPFALYTNVR
jgi:(1->4)-alpha-D-glucan 1-alpha-D-glucosylmutase